MQASRERPSRVVDTKGVFCLLVHPTTQMNIDNANDEICVALRDIRSGQELTCDYRKLNEAPQTLRPVHLN